MVVKKNTKFHSVGYLNNLNYSNGIKDQRILSYNIKFILLFRLLPNILNQPVPAVHTNCKITYLYNVDFIENL